METTRHIRHKDPTGDAPAPAPTIEDIDPGYADAIVNEIVDYGKPLSQWATGSTTTGGWDRQVIVTLYLDPVAGDRRYAVESITDDGDGTYDVWDYSERMAAFNAASAECERLGAHRRLAISPATPRPAGASS